MIPVTLILRNPVGHREQIPCALMQLNLAIPYLLKGDFASKPTCVIVGQKAHANRVLSRRREVNAGVHFRNLYARTQNGLLTRRMKLQQEKVNGRNHRREGWADSGRTDRRTEKLRRWQRQEE